MREIIYALSVYIFALFNMAAIKAYTGGGGLHVLG